MLGSLFGHRHPMHISRMSSMAYRLLNPLERILAICRRRRRRYFMKN